MSKELVKAFKRQPKAPQRFKAKTIVGEWVEGTVYQVMERMTLYTYIIGSTISQRWVVDPDTLCAWTGVFDKNGVKIYEGDILDVYTLGEYQDKTIEHRFITDVVWCQDACCYLINGWDGYEQRKQQVVDFEHEGKVQNYRCEQDYTDPMIDMRIKWSPLSEFTVIGNIYNEADFRRYAKEILRLDEYKRYKDKEL